MIVRGIDSNGDWLFGKGKSDYKYQVNALAQILQTRIKSFQGDCFFATNDNIDWFMLMGSRKLNDLRLAIASTILNTEAVNSLAELNVSIDPETRRVTIEYSVISVYGEISRSINFGVSNA